MCGTRASRDFRLSRHAGQGVQHRDAKSTVGVNLDIAITEPLSAPTTRYCASPPERADCHHTPRAALGGRIAMREGRVARATCGSYSPGRRARRDSPARSRGAKVSCGIRDRESHCANTPLDRRNDFANSLSEAWYKRSNLGVTCCCARRHLLRPLASAWDEPIVVAGRGNDVENLCCYLLALSGAPGGRQ
jgi:hypothetical protein